MKFSLNRFAPRTPQFGLYVTGVLLTGLVVRAWAQTNECIAISSGDDYYDVDDTAFPNGQCVNGVGGNDTLVGSTGADTLLGGGGDGLPGRSRRL